MCLIGSSGVGQLLPRKSLMSRSILALPVKKVTSDGLRHAQRSAGLGAEWSRADFTLDGPALVLQPLIARARTNHPTFLQTIRGPLIKIKSGASPSLILNAFQAPSIDAKDARPRPAFISSEKSAQSTPETTEFGRRCRLLNAAPRPCSVSFCKLRRVDSPDLHHLRHSRRLSRQAGPSVASHRRIDRKRPSFDTASERLGARHAAFSKPHSGTE